MTPNIMAQCADMIITDAIADYSRLTGQREEAVRTAIISSGAYESLYDYDTGLWQEGPDYFIDFFLRMSESRRDS